MESGLFLADDHARHRWRLPLGIDRRSHGHHDLHKKSSWHERRIEFAVSRHGTAIGLGNKATEEFLPERVDLRLSRVEMELFQRAAQQENQILTVWIRNRLRESLKEKSGS